MTSMTMRRLGALSALLLAAACGGDATGPKAGLVYVSIIGTPAARSVRFRLIGKQTALAALTGTTYKVFSAQRTGDTVDVAVIAPQGQTLSGAMLQVSVADVAAATSYSVKVIQVALPDYTLKDPSGYTPHIAQTTN